MGIAMGSGAGGWRATGVVWASALVAAVGSAAIAQNQPPAAPLLNKPASGAVVNPTSFLIESGPFSDPNPGDTHLCTDWEIYRGGERVWNYLCATGVERIRGYLSDGTFEGSHAGRNSLFPETTYTIRIRHRDSSGQAATEWGPWTTNTFTTAPLRAAFPLELADVLLLPVPRLIDPSGMPVPLPGTSGGPATLRLETASGEPLLTLTGVTGATPSISNPPGLPEPAVVRVVVSAGGAPLSLPVSNLLVTAGDGEPRGVYLPAMELSAGEQRVFWVSSNGSTYAGAAGQTSPDFTTLVRGAPAPWRVAPGYAVELVASGFSLPVNIEFVPNPRPEPDAPLYYVVELYGTIRVVLRNGEVRTFAANLLNYNPNGEFPGSGEQGLGDLAFDPLTGDLFMTYLYSSVPGQDAAAKFPAVDRLTTTDGGRRLGTRTRILDMPGEVQGAAHYISNISVGPDGYLWVHMGDGFIPETARNPNSYRGKILRMFRDGSPVPTNPFFNAANGINARDYTMALGLRNPFGGAWNLADQRLYFVCNGPNVDRLARLTPGFDYGWDGTDASMEIGASYVWAPAVAPVNIAFIQPQVFGGSGFPPSFHGRAFVTQFGGTFAIGPGNPRTKAITSFAFDASGAVIDGPRPVAWYDGLGASTVVALAAGPDGLYFSDFFAEFAFSNPTQAGSNIYRLRYVPPPPPPDCNANGIPDPDEIAGGLAQDCNANGRPDSCDIADGRSQDCNATGVPDDCEARVLVTTDFDDNSPGAFVLSGDASIQPLAGQGSAIRLTRTANFVIGSASRPPLRSEPMTSLRAEFDFRIGGGGTPGADGLSFAAFDAATYDLSVPFSEEGPGTQSHEPPAGPRTLVVQFDTFDNFQNGQTEGSNTIEVALGGVTIARATPPFDLNDNTLRRAIVTFENGSISVVVRGPGSEVFTAMDRVPVPGYVPFVAALGFGGRTGGLNDEHWIDNVAFAIPGPNDTNANGIPDSCECTCSTDYDGSGSSVPDLDDLLAFFADFAAGDDRADVDCTGPGSVPDVNDLVRFFEVFTNGCP